MNNKKSIKKFIIMENKASIQWENFQVRKVAKRKEKILRKLWLTHKHLWTNPLISTTNSYYTKKKKLKRKEKRESLDCIKTA